jgi:hypothetical protein
MNTTNERPILFSAKMVRAILSGAKTQTRRVVRAPVGYRIDGHARAASYAIGGEPVILCSRPAGSRGERVVHCPYGERHHRLWVRETFAPRYFDDGTVGYRADWDDKASDVAAVPRWKPSIFMRRHEARIVLEVTEVRVQRLQAISEEDARAEGVEAAPFCKAGRANGLEHVEEFERIWDQINGKREGCSWTANPWVWCVSFKRMLSRPQLQLKEPSSRAVRAPRTDAVGED